MALSASTSPSYHNHKMKIRPWLVLAAALFVLLSGTTSYAQDEPIAAEAPRYAEEAALLWEQMTPQERVGQLFVVSFEGDELTADAEIISLIAENNIGGVLLTAENGNFASAPDTLESLSSLNQTLQTVAISGPSAIFTDTEDLEPTFRVVQIPLFIATTHGGGAEPEILDGVSEIPSPMGLGATWSTDQTTFVGELLGRELDQLGFNLLIGPSLNIVDDPNLLLSNEIGTSAFGGNPYWVGQLGQAYLQGVKAGSNGRIAVIGTGFPGSGASDRPLGEEASTVRRDFEMLAGNELQPFFAVTGAETPIDGLMTSHVRYDGLQGNVQATTPLLSFDPQAMAELGGLPEIASWLEQGLMVSPMLGDEAVVRIYDPSGSGFPHRQIAKDALLAGNDLLVIDQYGEADRAVLIQDTIGWFLETYLSDPAVRDRIDTAGIKILQSKLRLYDGDFSLAGVIGNDPLPIAGSDLIYPVAQSSIALISPSGEDIANRLPAAPSADDRIVIFTDTGSIQQCPGCPAEPVLSRTAFEERMLAAYGPDASGQVSPNQIRSFDFGELDIYLNAPDPLPTPSPTLDPDSEDDEGLEESEAELILSDSLPPTAAYEVEQALAAADVLIIALNKVESGTDSAAFNRLLAERPALLRNKTVIVFAFELPIYLDATEISQLSAYYGAFSPSKSYLDAAVRTIFRELAPTGASPISIAGSGYDVGAVIAPKADQVIELSLIDINGELLDIGQTPLDLEPGDTLRLQTGIIQDLNGNPVPDGTLVRFTQNDRVNGFFDVIADVPTANGIARFDYILENRPGQYRLSVSTGAAEISEEVDIAIVENESASVVVITPTPVPQPTATLQPTPTPSPQPTVTPRPTDTQIPTQAPIPPTDSSTGFNISYLEIQRLLGMFVGLMFLGLFVGRKRPNATIRVRYFLWSIIAAFSLYIYFMLPLPGADRLMADGWSSFGLIWLGGLVGWLAAMGYGLGMRLRARFSRE